MVGGEKKKKEKGEKYKRFEYANLLFASGLSFSVRLFCLGPKEENEDKEKVKEKERGEEEEDNEKEKEEATEEE